MEMLHLLLWICWLCVGVVCDGCGPCVYKIQMSGDCTSHQLQQAIWLETQQSSGTGSHTRGFKATRTNIKANARTIQPLNIEPLRPEQTKQKYTKPVAYTDDNIPVYVLIKKLRSAFANLKKKYTDTKSRLKELELLLRASWKNHNETKSQLKKESQRLYEARQDISQLSDSLLSCRRHYNESLLQVNDLETKLYKCEVSSAKLSDTLAISRDKLNKTAFTLNATQTKLNETSKELLLSEQHKKQCRGHLSKCKTTNHRLNSEVIHLTSKVNDTKEELFLSKRQMNQCTEELADCTTNLDTLTGVVKGLQAEVNQSKSNLQQCEKALKSSTQQVVQLTEKEENTAKQLDSCKEQGRALNETLVETQQHAEQLQESFYNLSEMLNETQRRLELCSNLIRPAFCGFEEPSLCGFTQEGVLEWRHWSSRTPSDNTGPSLDHTCNSQRGHYMYVESSGVAAGDLARLMSPLHQSAGLMCVEFYYNMYGRDVGTLNVYLLVEGEVTDELPPPVWRAYGNQGDLWTVARLHVPPEAARRGYRVVFEVLTTAGYAGDVAIDDVRVFPGGCEESDTLEQWRVLQRNHMLDVLREAMNKLNTKT